MEYFEGIISFNPKSEDHWCSRYNEEYPFEDENKKFYLTIEHYYKSFKFITTDPSFAERIRLSTSAKEAKILSNDISHPFREDWDKVKYRIMKHAIRLKINSNKKLKNRLINSECVKFIANTNNEFWGNGMDGYGSNEYGNIILQIRDELIYPTIKNKSSSSVSTNTRKQRKKNNRKRKNNIYKLPDGSARFDLVSSDSVCISVTGDKLIIPMSALPTAAKKVTKDYQYFKKRHPESIDDNEEFYYDYDIDSDCEEYIYHREEHLSNDDYNTSIYSDELVKLIELGYTDCESNYAALVTSGGDLIGALDYLE